jgi:RNA polymerase sporulation-specific sigma factor
MEDMLQLISQAQKGDKQVRDTLIEENLGLVHHIVKRFLNRGYDAEELFQIGCIGLMKAVDHFDTDYDVKFSTYAVPLIFGEIRRFLRDDGIIKVSREEKRIAVLINKEREMRRNLGLPTDIYTLAEALGISAQDAASAMFSEVAPRSLEESVFDEGDSVTLGSMISDESDADRFDKLALRMAIETLDEEKRQIVYLRYFKDYSQSETAKILGLSQVKISREEKKIIAHLRSKM